MNIDNVVLVRAMNNLPINGELVPSCEGQRLVSDKQSDFYYLMRREIIKYLENRLGRSLNLEQMADKELFENMESACSILMGDYYTTTLSFSLNGMVPDDINNNFTEMSIAVIDPIKHHTEENFVTVNTIDTTIKGRMKVSKDAILLVKREVYKSLDQSIKENLKNNYNIELFEGELRTAVDETLKNNNYPSLPLVQKRELSNIQECAEKKGMIEFEDKFADKVGASRARLQNLTLQYSPTSTGVDKIAHDKLEEEFKNTLTIQQYYKEQLYNFLLTKAEQLGINLTEEEKWYLFTEYSQGTEVMEEMVKSIIQKCGGLTEFIKIIQEYNQYVKNNYRTSKEIIESLQKQSKTM